MTRDVTKRLTQTAVWTAVSITLAVLGVLLLSTIDNPDGTPWLESSIVAQTLAMLGVIVAALVPSIISTRKDTAEVREQVQNAHKTADGSPLNLRDDLDEKHDTVVEAIKHLTRLVEGVIEDERDGRDNLKALSRRVDANSKAIREVNRKLELPSTTLEIPIVHPPGGTQ
jgi:ABC-type nickel/cobalt efflux system permease component RcnA